MAKERDGTLTLTYACKLSMYLCLGSCLGSSSLTVQVVKTITFCMRVRTQ